jgi:ubiquitin C-terminal hydrolase
MSINSPPTRFAKRRIEYLSDMKMYAEKINETAQQFQHSVLEALKRDTQSNDNSSRKRFKKSVTENASRQQLPEIEQEKINRAIELENRK